MNEYQRQAYLDALGVEQYVPRWLMPHAPAPKACELPVLREEVPALNAGATPEAPEPRQPGSPKPVSDFLADFRQPAAKPALREPTPEPTAPVEPAQELVVPFTLSIWRSPLPVLVLDSRQPRAAMPTDRLLRNLLQALGLHDPQQVREEVLPWPSVRHAGMRLSANDARAELATWLEQELTKHPVRHIMLMGENATRYLLPEGNSYEAALWKATTLAPVEVPTLVAPSLLELLRDPSLKRPLWKALQAWFPLNKPST